MVSKTQPTWKAELITTDPQVLECECDYCGKNKQTVYYVFGSHDASISEITLCLACRNYMLSVIFIQIANRRARDKINEAKGVKTGWPIYNYKYLLSELESIKGTILRLMDSAESE